MKQRRGRFDYWRSSIAAALIIVLSTAAWAGQDKKKKKSDNSDQGSAALPVPDTDQIENNIGQMLGAFQMGDVEAMHKYYSDNVTIVRSGAFEPPIVGWQNYAADYKSQWSSFQGVQIIRSNTLIFTRPDVSWATYQWDFIAMLNGKPFSARGQTTLVFTKVNGNWLIVHNHTSEICPATPPAQPPSAQVNQPGPHLPGL